MKRLFLFKKLRKRFVIYEEEAIEYLRLRTKPKFPFIFELCDNARVCFVPYTSVLVILCPCHTCARNYRPSYRENKPKTLVLND
jgi:hypothetical protein